MRLIPAVLALFALCAPAFAQLDPLPPSDIAVLPGEAAWSATELYNYRLASGYTFAAPTAGGTDAFGHSWATTAPDMSGLYFTGGTERLIFLGPWQPGFKAMGYAYGGAPTFTEAVTLAQASHSIQFGDHADINLAPGDADKSDAWLITDRGIYTLLYPDKSPSAAPGSQILWTTEPLLVPTYIPALGTARPVETWFVDLIEPAGEGLAYTDPIQYRFALQRFAPQGVPAENPVPEPATYGAAGAVLLGLATVARRRLRARRIA